MSVEASENQPLPGPQGPDASPGARLPARLIAGLLSLTAIVAAAGIGYYWMTHKPKAQRRPPVPEAALVEVALLEATTHRVVIAAMGTVVPAREVQLASRVGGEIVELSDRCLPGGRFAAGEVIARIDPEDYQLAVRQQEAELQRRAAEVQQRAGELAQRQGDVIRTQSELDLEMGQQAVAKREFELLGKDLTPADRLLVLRQPQLKTAQANCDSAKAVQRAAEGTHRAAVAMKAAAEVALEKARLDESRTTVRAPFNAVIQSRSVNLGSQVGAGTTLASLVGTDEYWVQVLVPVDQLKWIRIPGVNGQQGAKCRMSHDAAWGADRWREGTVKRLMPDLEPEGRVARLLISVSDPLVLTDGRKDRPAMLISAYVRVEVEGPELADVIRIRRTDLHDGNRAWIMDDNGKLDIRKVQVAWSTADHVYISGGVSAGEKLVTGNLVTPTQGKALRTAGAGAESRLADEAGPATGKPGEARP